MLSPNSIAPDSTVLNNVVNGLILLTQQIQGIAQTFPQVPDGPPPDNSVVYVLRNIGLTTPEDGKIRWDMEYEIVHLFQRTNLSTVLATAYSYIGPWVNVLSCLQNSDLNGTVQETYPLNVTLQSYSFANMPYIAIVTIVHIITDINETR